MIKKDKRVEWVATKFDLGRGVTVSDEFSGRVLVALDHDEKSEVPDGMSLVICFDVRKLTEVE